MTDLTRRVQRLNTTDDPGGLFAAIGTTAGAVLALLVVLGVLDGATAEAILAVVVTIGPLWLALSIRRHAWAPSSVSEARENAFRQGARLASGGDDQEVQA